MKTIQISIINNKGELEESLITGKNVGYEIIGNFLKYWQDDNTYVVPSERLVSFHIKTK